MRTDTISDHLWRKGHSEVSATTLDVARLGPLGRELGNGGQAIVYDLPGFALRNEPQRLVYKRYRPGMSPSPHSLTRLIGRRQRLAPMLRDRLDAITAWPLAAVVDGADLLGVLMPRIPDAYFQDVVLPSGTAKAVVREAQYLFVPPDRNTRIHMLTPSPEQRLRICRDLADALMFLHAPELQIVFGDLNAKNELFRLDAEPTVMLVDCDAMRPRGDTGPQPNTPDWIPADPNEALSTRSDCYKLGLFVLRCLTPGAQGSTRTDPAMAGGVLDAAGVNMLRAAIGGSVAERPSAAEWVRYLSVCLGEPVDPPTLDSVAPDRTMVAAGEPLTVRWTASNAEVLELVAPGSDPVQVDGRAGAGDAEVYPRRTGRVEVVARNRLGAAAELTAPVMVVDMPRWSDLPVPLPVLPTTGAHLPPLPELAAVLPLPAVGAVGLPSAAEPVGAWTPPELSRPAVVAAHATNPPPAFDSGMTAMPVDVVALLTGAPELGDGPTTRGRAVR